MVFHFESFREAMDFAFRDVRLKQGVSVVKESCLLSHGSTRESFALRNVRFDDGRELDTICHYVWKPSEFAGIPLLRMECRTEWEGIPSLLCPAEYIEKASPPEAFAENAAVIREWRQQVLQQF